MMTMQQARVFVATRFAGPRINPRSLEMLADWTVKFGWEYTRRQVADDPGLLVVPWYTPIWMICRGVQGPSEVTA